MGILGHKGASYIFLLFVLVVSVFPGCNNAPFMHILVNRYALLPSFIGILIPNNRHKICDQKLLKDLTDVFFRYICIQLCYAWNVSIDGYKRNNNRQRMFCSNEQTFWHLTFISSVKLLWNINRKKTQLSYPKISRAGTYLTFFLAIY